VYDTVSTLSTLGGSQKNWSLDAVGNWERTSKAAGGNSETVT